MADAREVMNIRQASQYLGVSPDTLYKYVSEEMIPAFNIGTQGGGGTVQRFITAVLLGLISVSSTGPQEVKHAPTVEQCRADQRLWLSKLKSDSGVVSVSFKELSGWSREMHECLSVDPEFHNRYYNTGAEISFET